jgi:hypothetical protein
MHKRLFDHQDGGITRTYHWETDGEDFMIASTQDAGAILEQNKHLQKDRTGSLASSSRNHTFYKIGDIPLINIEQWMKEDGVNILALPKLELSNYIKRKLQHPDYMYLRTAPERFFNGTRGSQRTYFTGTTLAPTAGDIARQQRARLSNENKMRRAA